MLKKTAILACIVLILPIRSFAQKIADGQEHFISVCDDSTVMAWGENYYGELGLGDTTNRQNPTQINGLTGIVAVATSGLSSYALKNDGTVWAWGSDSHGALGDGTTVDKHSPVQVSGLTGVIAIAGGAAGGPLALKSDSTVWYWGGNTGSYVPIQVSGLSGVVSMASAGDSWLALKRDGSVWAWGNNSFGQLGIATTSTVALNPVVQVHNPNNTGFLTGITKIAGGSDFFLALKSDSTVLAWGYNYYGQLGNNTTNDTALPVQVDSLSGIIAIGAGMYHSLAVKKDGSVWAWGYDFYEQTAGGGLTPNKVWFKHMRIPQFIS